MQAATPISRSGEEPAPGIAAFYRHVLEILNASAVPFLVGGGYAFSRYTGIIRYTKDLDIFIHRQDFTRVSEALLAAGYETELTYPHWLGKIRANEVYIDLIFSSGNGIAEVDDAWFAYASEAQVLGVPARICPVEEMIWSKAFVMERERYDGADIAHLLRACGSQLDWPRLLRRFESHWRILLNHLILFGFVYPAHRNMVPVALMDDLIDRLRHETHTAAPQQRICLGTLLSREQYLSDIEQQGLQDGRIIPVGKMTAEDIVRWTQAIPDGDEAC